MTTAGGLGPSLCAITCQLGNSGKVAISPQSSHSVKVELITHHPSHNYLRNIHIKNLAQYLVPSRCSQNGSLIKREILFGNYP